jgi:Flagellar protein YcgR/PilZ domain
MGANVDAYLDDLDVGRRIAIDFGTELQLEIDGVAGRLRSELVGMDHGKYLIVKTPTVAHLGGIGGKLYSGNRVVVRYVYAGSVYGFETSVIDAITTPVRVVFLTCPKVVNERNIRSSRRIETLLPARITVGDKTAEGTVTDISTSGCHFRIKVQKGAAPFAAKKEIDKDMELSVQLPGVPGELSIQGTLKNERKEEGTVELGIAFADLDEETQSRIAAYIELTD